MSEPSQTRTPYRGSCHCGAVRYILHLQQPHIRSPQLLAPRGVQHIYRCNCTLCHKTGHMHVRPSSPLDPTCAARCFIFAGDGELVDADLDAMGVSGGGHPQMGHYLSVNAHSIDAGQGFDMRELSDKEQVMYCDCYSSEELEVPMRYGQLQENGSY